jgi:hypothetical protein
MKSSSLIRSVVGAIGLASLLGAAAPAQAGGHFHPFVPVPVIVPPPVYVAPPVYVPPAPVYVAPPPVYAPAVYDSYLMGVGPADVVYLNGSTYVWRVDAHGRRYRHFYGHGDHRPAIFHRRDELRGGMHHDGGHREMGHPGGGHHEAPHREVGHHDAGHRDAGHPAGPSGHAAPQGHDHKK